MKAISKRVMALVLSLAVLVSLVAVPKAKAATTAATKMDFEKLQDVKADGTLSSAPEYTKATVTTNSALIDYSAYVQNSLSYYDNIVGYTFVMLDSNGQTKDVGTVQCTEGMTYQYNVTGLASYHAYGIVVYPVFWEEGATSASISQYVYDEVVFWTNPSNSPRPTITKGDFGVTTIYGKKTIVPYVTVNNKNLTASGVEYRLYDRKTNRLVASETSSKAGAYFSGVSTKKAYYVMARTYRTCYDGKKVFSSWSAKKYFIGQPSISSKSSRYYTKNNTIKIKWNKVQCAQSYTVYAKKANSKKWVKIKTLKKTSLTISKIKKSKLKVKKYKYDVTVVANMKVGRKNVSSYKCSYWRTKK